MKRFLFSVTAVAVFFLGVGALVEKTGASFKSDAKALELVRKARQAIGGDTAVTAIRSMTIKGRSTVTATVDGAERQETGESEIALQFPNKMTRSVKLGDLSASGAHQVMNRQFDVVVTGDKARVKSVEPLRTDGQGATINKKIVVKNADGTVQELTGAEADAWIAAHPNVPGEKRVVIRKADGHEITATSKSGETVVLRHADGADAKTWTTADGRTFNVEAKTIVHDNAAGPHGAGHARSNEFLRTTLALLLTAPEGMDVAYTDGGESTFDGVACNVVVASFGGESFKLYLDRSSSVPVGMAYTGIRTPRMIAFERPAPSDAAKDVVMFRQAQAGAGEVGEYQVRFSDYRAVGGVQLPFRWVQTVDGKSDETFEVSNYELNPANIAEKFSDQKVLVRMAKPATK